jgi:4-hydroxy-3-methylbut-2-enyl diphosphate reductase
LVVTVIKEAGFCFGVKRATQLAFEAAANKKGRVFTMGPLIHNPQVVAELAQAGVDVVSDLSQVEQGTLIVRSHGLHPQILKQAQQKGLNIVDATCPFVKKVQNYAAALRDEGYQVVIIGDEDHPEVQGIKGYCGNDILVLGNKTDIDNLNLGKKLGVVAQTTQSVTNFSEIISRLVEQAGEIKIYNTICKATYIRQKATLELARQVELMIVVGGRNSANTNRLVELCRQINTPTHLVEVADEIDPFWLKGKQTVGISAGASTPQEIISHVLERLKALN